MFELSVRLLLAGGLVLLAGLLGWENFNAVGITSACFGIVSLGGYWLDWTNRKNPGFAGLIASLDAFAIAALLATSGQLSSFGFLVLAPCAYAAAKYGSLPSAMAPIASFGLLGADQWANNGLPPSLPVFGQALGVLGIGMLLNHRRIIVSVAKPVLPTAVEPLQAEEPEAFLELRESFRKLRDMYADLERKSRRDRFSADLRLALAPDGDRFHKRLAAQLKKISGAEGVSLYTLAEHAGGTVLRAVEGAVSEPIRQSVLQVNPQEAIAIVRDQSERALRAVADPAEAALLRNVVITHRGRVVGLAALHCDTGRQAQAAAEALEEVAPIIGEILQEGASREIQENRMRRAELLYELASAEAGSATRNGLAARFVRELADLVDIENLSLSWIDGESLLTAATHGGRSRPFEALSFSAGPGVHGWLQIGAPEIVARDIGDDARCRRTEMSKQRIQSLAIFPVGSAGLIEGALTATSPRSGAIDAQTADSLRLAAAELTQAVLRLEPSGDRASGTVSASEFQDLLTRDPSGCLVYLDPVRRDEMASRYGKPALEIALKQFVHRVRTQLPPGGALLRRAEGEIIVYLPNLELAQARSWANETAAIASLIGIPVQESGRKAPLAIRARAAQIAAESPSDPVLTAS